MSIHPTAIISDKATIAKSAVIGPYCVVEAGAELGKEVVLASHVVVKTGSVLAKGVRVDPFCVIGGDPQSLKFDAAVESGVSIGENTVLREAVTVSRATEAGKCTTIGANCLLMANAHVGHDGHLGDGVVLANNVMLGGYVTIERNAFLGGGAGVHQFVRIGRLSMIAGNASISADVPPYLMVAERNEACGLNLVGLRRAGIDTNAISDLKRCYRAVFYGGGNLSIKAAAAGREHEFGVTEPGLRFLNFFSTTKRGFVRSRQGDV